MNAERSRTLNDVCEFIVDCLHKTAPIQKDGYPSIRTPNVGRGRLLLEGANRVSDATYEEWTRRAVPLSNDLILAREAPAGNVAIIKNGQIVCLGQRTVHLRPNPSQVDPGFLCYYLLAPAQQGALLAGETGATAGHVNMRDIRRLRLNRLPALSVQRKAGAVLAAYDDLITNNTRRIELLERSARLLFEEWFVRLRYPGHEHDKIVDGVPQGWERKKLGEVFPLSYGKAMPETKRLPGDFLVYGSSGEVGTHQEKLVPGPGIVVGRKGNVGSVYWVDSDFWPIDTVYFVEPDSVSLFGYHMLSSQSFENSDAAVPGLNRDYAHGKELKWPSAQLRDSYEQFVKPLFLQRGKLIAMNARLRAACDHLLPRLMDGGIEA
jgi:type I restriction enzyme S subunit